MGRILDHGNTMYQMRMLRAGKNRHNGAYYYAEEIKRNIIPNVRTDRNWVLVNQQGMCMDHSIVFVHNNIARPHYSTRSDTFGTVIGLECSECACVLTQDPSGPILWRYCPNCGAKVVEE